MEKGGERRRYENKSEMRTRYKIHERRNTPDKEYIIWILENTIYAGDDADGKMTNRSVPAPTRVHTAREPRLSVRAILAGRRAGRRAVAGRVPRRGTAWRARDLRGTELGRACRRTRRSGEWRGIGCDVGGHVADAVVEALRVRVAANLWTKVFGHRGKTHETLSEIVGSVENTKNEVFSSVKEECT